MKVLATFLREPATRPAGLLQLVDARDREDHHVGGLAGIELGLQGADGAEVERDLMAGALRERLAERAHRHMHRARAHHLELGHPALRPS